MNRNDITEKIITAKVSKGLTWEAVARQVGQSKEWTTALCLGQMTATSEQAAVLGEIFSLSQDEQKWLQVVPYKGSLPTAVPTDPLIYRWYEIDVLELRRSADAVMAPSWTAGSSAIHRPAAPMTGACWCRCGPLVALAPGHQGNRC